MVLLLMVMMYERWPLGINIDIKVGLVLSVENDFFILNFILIFFNSGKCESASSVSCSYPGGNCLCTANCSKLLSLFCLRLLIISSGTALWDEAIFTIKMPANTNIASFVFTLMPVSICGKTKNY